jgi:Fic family protein
MAKGDPAAVGLLRKRAQKLNSLIDKQTHPQVSAVLQRVRRSFGFRLRDASVLRAHHHLQPKPIITIPATAEQLSLSAPTVAKALQHMVKLGMVRETTGKPRHRLFTYHRYLEILNRGTELPTRSH